MNHKFKDFPLLIAANRDEDYKRPSSPVQVLSKEPLIIGGKDDVKGGTWLAVNKHSMFAAITNQGAKADKAISRGLIPLELLKCKTLDEMIELVEGLDPSKYNGFNLVFGNQHKIYVAHSYILHSMVINELPEGVSVVTNDMKFNGPSEKVSFIHERLDSLFDDKSIGWLAVYKKLKKILANTEFGIKIKPRKKDGNLYGHCTRSSSILAFSKDGLARYKFHDRTAYKPRKNESDPYVPRYKDYVDLWRDPSGKTVSAPEEEKDDIDEKEEPSMSAKEVADEIHKKLNKMYTKDGFFAHWRKVKFDDEF